MYCAPNTFRLRAIREMIFFAVIRIYVAKQFPTHLRINIGSVHFFGHGKRHELQNI